MKQGILVIREFDKFSVLLAENGLEVINLPLIQTIPAEDLSDLDARLEKIQDYDGLFFTSPIAAQIFLERFQKKNPEFGGRIYVLGGRAKGLFENADFEVVFRENANTAEELINSFAIEEFADKRFLFLRGEKSLRAIPELLRGKAVVDEITVYQTLERPIDENLSARISQKIERGEIGWICFFSPSGFESFVKSFGADLLNKLNIAAIGTTTARKIAGNGLKADFVSPKANAEDFAFGLIEFFKGQGRERSGCEN